VKPLHHKARQWTNRSEVAGYLQPTIRDEHLEIIKLVEEKMIYCSQNYVSLKERMAGEGMIQPP